MTDVRSIREALGISQVELATKLGLHQSTVSRLETGAMPVDARTALALDMLLKLKGSSVIESASTADDDSRASGNSDKISSRMERAA
ncbi:MAG: helix-turn-helix transcriptional regulator [Sphingomonas sp.]|nr:helix-turn-helix transcriptional regulator [Sphingomonas sp.]MDX3885567.1 helix-turn-helix transcriptional regulator [Sphingomonas sp.]